MAKSKSSYEASFEKLKELSEKIKAPDTDLESAIKCYEEGLKAYQECDKILTEAKQKIESFDIKNKVINEEI